MAEHRVGTMGCADAFVHGLSRRVDLARLPAPSFPLFPARVHSASGLLWSVSKESLSSKRVCASCAAFDRCHPHDFRLASPGEVSLPHYSAATGRFHLTHYACNRRVTKSRPKFISCLASSTGPCCLRTENLTSCSDAFRLRYQSGEQGYSKAHL